MALSTQRLHVNSKGIVENVLYSLADNNPQQYATSFLRLAAWVDNSLDMYRVSTPPARVLRLGLTSFGGLPDVTHSKA